MCTKEIRYLSDSSPVDVAISTISMNVGDVGPKELASLEVIVSVGGIERLDDASEVMLTVRCLPRLTVHVVDDFDDRELLASIEIGMTVTMEAPLPTKGTANLKELEIELLTDALTTGYSFASSQVLALTSLTHMRGLFMPPVNRDGMRGVVLNQLAKSDADM